MTEISYYIIIQLPDISFYFKSILLLDNRLFIIVQFLTFGLFTISSCIFFILVLTLSFRVVKMNIDKLPDECLLYIFNFFYRFDTLLNCAEVSERWKGLVLERLHNVKYLTDFWTRFGFPARDSIIFQYELEASELSKWFPKHKILVSSRQLDVNFVENLKVKGLAFDYSQQDLPAFHNPSLEMLAIPYFSTLTTYEIQGPLLKQLYITNCNVADFADYAKYFPNLKRLHISKYDNNPSYDYFYTGPVIEKLEILEMHFAAHMLRPKYYGFSLADRCPALKSAYHYIETSEDPFVNSGIKNNFLEDLVLHLDVSYDWSILRSILSKYPNLKHLAIRNRYQTGISDENIPEILKLLPHIILIDIRNSPKVTEKSTEYIDRYCRYHNRSISFYYQKRPKITEKWPHLSVKRFYIGREFDFMKYCFLNITDNSYRYCMPIFLDPDD